MLKKRKAQAAMEFLMTYGWAILVVLIVIGALAYFGVLDPQRLLPPRCTLPPGMLCKDYVVSQADDEIRLEVQNGLGRAINVTAADATAVGDTPVTCTNAAVGAQIPNGESGQIVLTCPAIAASYKDPGRKWRWDIAIYWHYADTDSSYAKSYAGELFTSID